MTWRERAACGLETAHLFGSVDGTDRGVNFLVRLREAQKVCDGCPLTGECLDLARGESLSGVFGGVYVSVGRLVNPAQVRVAS